MTYDNESIQETSRQLVPTNYNQRRLIKFIDGIPVPVYEDVIPATSYRKVIEVALSQPYEGYTDQETGEKIIEAKYEGLSHIEVAMLRLAEQAALGDKEAVEMLFDRALGKPKQATENVNLNTTLEDWLDHLDSLTNNKNSSSSLIDGI